MSEFFTQIISSFGAYGAIIIAVFAGVVWLLAHTSAAEGTSVSVMWGLVAYTKSAKSKKTKETVVPTAHWNTKASSTKAEECGATDSEDYRIGMSLKLVGEQGILASDEEGYLVYSEAWAKGVLRALDGRTSSQKDSEIARLVDDHWSQIVGEVVDFDQSFLTVNTDRGYVRLHMANCDESIKEHAAKLHVGDRVKILAKISPSLTGIQAGIFICPTEIERTI